MPPAYFWPLFVYVGVLLLHLLVPAALVTGYVNGTDGQPKTSAPFFFELGKGTSLTAPPVRLSLGAAHVEAAL